METQAALPQLDEAITFLQAEIAALRAGEKDFILPALAVAVAAGEAPLPEPQFTPLLARWTPAPTSFSTELAALVDQFEAAKRREKENELQKELRDGALPMHSALQRVRGKRSKPRTRPRRRFEDPDTGDASASASDGTPTASPRDDVVKKVEKMKEDKKMEEKVEIQGMKQKEKGKTQEQAMETKVVVEMDPKFRLGTTISTKENKDVGVEKTIEERFEGEDMAKENKEKGKEKVRKKKDQEEEEKRKKTVEVTKEEKNEKNCARQEKVVEKKAVKEEMIVKRQKSEEKKNVVGSGKSCKVEEKGGREKKKKAMITVKNEVEESGRDKYVKMEEKQVAEDKNSEKEEAEAALASLKSLRKSMLLDVLSKIVSVAKSKGVDPAMFTTDKIEEETTTTNGKAVDLKTIQERVASGVVCEWAQFAEQVYLFCQHVVANAEQREQQEARRKGVELLHFARTLTETLRKASVKKEMTLLQRIYDAEEAATARKEEEAAWKREATSIEKRDEHVNKMNERTEMVANAAAPAKDYDSNMTTYGDDTGPSPLTPTRALRRIRMRPSLPSDETEQFMSGNPRKRVRGAPISASEDASGSESHDASASEADGKSRGCLKSSKTSAKRTPTRRRRPIIPATRTSSRQQKRRAAAAAAAAVADSGDEEISGGEPLLVGDDEKKKENEDDEFKKHEHDDEHFLKKKNGAKAKARKKTSRKRA